MKSALYFLLAYLAGVHGFAMFAPYAACFLLLVHVLRMVTKAQRLRTGPVSIPVRIQSLTSQA